MNAHVQRFRDRRIDGSTGARARRSAQQTARTRGRSPCGAGTAGLRETQVGVIRSAESDEGSSIARDYLAPHRQISLVNNPRARVVSEWTTMTGAALARAGHASFANRRTHSTAWTNASDERSASHASASARGASPGSGVAPRRFTPSSGRAPRSRTGLLPGATAGRRRVVAAATSEPSRESSGSEKESPRLESVRGGGTTKDDWSHVTPDWLYETIEARVVVVPLRV